MDRCMNTAILRYSTKLAIPQSSFVLHCSAALDLIRPSLNETADLNCAILVRRLRSELSSDPVLGGVIRAEIAERKLKKREKKRLLRLRKLMRQEGVSVQVSHATRRRGVPLPRIDWPRQEADHERPDLSLSPSELAAFIDELPVEELPLLRVLSLRVVGGWSLREIAKRDGRHLTKRPINGCALGR
jgi:hypothetical protein